jgi:hypothetical protein
MSPKQLAEVLEFSSGKLKAQFCRMAAASIAEVVREAYLKPKTELLKAEMNKRKEKGQHAVLNVRQGGLWTSETMLAKVRCFTTHPLR